MTTVDNNLAQSFFRLMSCFLSHYIESEVRRVSVEELDGLDAMVESFLIFSLIWSVACTVDYDSRKKFSDHIRTLMIVN